METVYIGPWATICNTTAFDEKHHLTQHKLIIMPFVLLLLMQLLLLLLLISDTLVKFQPVYLVHVEKSFVTARRISGT